MFSTVFLCFIFNSKVVIEMVHTHLSEPLPPPPPPLQSYLLM